MIDMEKKSEGKQRMGAQKKLSESNPYKGIAIF